VLLAVFWRKGEKGPEGGRGSLLSHEGGGEEGNTLFSQRPVGKKGGWSSSL